VGKKIIGEGDRVSVLATMNKLQDINSEYEARTGSPVQLNPHTVWDAESTKPLYEQKYHFKNSLWYIWQSIEYFVEKTRDHSETRELYAIGGKGQTALTDASTSASRPWDPTLTKEDQQALESATGLFTQTTNTGNGKKEIHDLWGKKLVYKQVHLTDTTLAWNQQDTDGRARTDFIPMLQAGPYFASAGPDKLFGNIRALASTTASDRQTKAAQASKDNIYSFEALGAPEQ
ncbi:MAG: hypothetical protein R3236_10215, partial [Phycisphaeraceae bacterium]|nr:hypothetical protein [Phycisphaeraceae bacterium]